MVNKHFLDSFLKINHGDATLSDTEVSAVLAQAGWSQTEIDSALILLNNNGSMAAKKEVVSFRPDMEFSSSQISSLLGVDVNIDAKAIRSTSAAIEVRSLAVQIFFVCVTILVSLSLAAGAAIVSAHYLEIGPFAK